MQIEQIPLHGPLHRLHRVALLGLNRLGSSNLCRGPSDGSGRLVDQVSFVKGLGLHGGDASKDGEDLTVAGGGNGAMEEEFMHVEGR